MRAGYRERSCRELRFLQVALVYRWVPRAWHREFVFLLRYIKECTSSSQSVEDLNSYFSVSASTGKTLPITYLLVEQYLVIQVLFRYPFEVLFLL